MITIEGERRQENSVGFSIIDVVQRLTTKQSESYTPDQILKDAELVLKRLTSISNRDDEISILPGDITEYRVGNSVAIPGKGKVILEPVVGKNSPPFENGEGTLTIIHHKAGVIGRIERVAYRDNVHIILGYQLPTTRSVRDRRDIYKC